MLAQISNAPATVMAKPVSVAWMLGASDAESSRPIFAPEMYFVRQVDKIAYAFGWEAVRGANEMTRDFTMSVNWVKP